MRFAFNKNNVHYKYTAETNNFLHPCVCVCISRVLIYLLYGARLTTLLNIVYNFRLVKRGHIYDSDTKKKIRMLINKKCEKRHMRK